MRGNTGNLGAANLLKNKKGPVAEVLGTALGLLKALVLGLMLSCGTAYASEPASPAPAATTNHVNANLNSDASPAVGDLVFDGGIAFLIIVMGLFLAISYFDSKDKDKDET